jgi:hypothetical protein
MHGHDYQFARDAEEGNIVRHNPWLLAYFRAPHCLEMIPSEKYIRCVLKYWSKNPDSGQRSLKMSFIKGMSSLELSNCDILLQLVALLPLNASSAFAGAETLYETDC